MTLAYVTDLGNDMFRLVRVGRGTNGGHDFVELGIPDPGEADRLRLVIASSGVNVFDVAIHDDGSFDIIAYDEWEALN